MADLILPASLAVWDPLGGTPEPVMTGHDGVCFHTMAGTFAGTDSYFHQDGWGGTESTVGIAGSGYCKQWVPWNRQADANLEGNPRWLSIECADYGESFPPSSTASDESPPMTDAQIERGIQLCVYWCDVRNHQSCPTSWACHSQGIPARFINNSCERGIGCHYHGIEGRGLVAGCPRWSSSGGKICNRMVRLRQVRDQIVPEVQRRLNQEDDMTPDECRAVVREEFDRAFGPVPGGTETRKALAELCRDVPAKTVVVKGDVSATVYFTDGMTKRSVIDQGHLNTLVELGVACADYKDAAGNWQEHVCPQAEVDKIPLQA